MDTSELWVVVPAYNEAQTIGATLAALAAQTDRDFTLVVVDNGCTDATADVVDQFGAQAPFPVFLVAEPGPGAGTAADTGFRLAIDRGATLLARTDADSLPTPTWVAAAKAVLRGGAEMACGHTVPRPDEGLTLADRWVLPAVIWLAVGYARIRRDYRDPRYRTPYVWCCGANIALTAELYQRCGGTVRAPLEQLDEDVALLNRAREHSDRIVRAKSMLVQTSLRRLRAWGYRRTLLWHWDRRYRPACEADVHVRAVPGRRDRSRHSSEEGQPR